MRFFLLLQSCGLHHAVKSTVRNFLRLMPAYRNEVGVIRMHILVVASIPLLDCPAMPFNQFVKFRILHRSLVLNEHRKGNKYVPFTQTVIDKKNA